MNQKKNHTIWVFPLVITPNTSWVVVFVFRETAATFVPTCIHMQTWDKWWLKKVDPINSVTLHIWLCNMHLHVNECGCTCTLRLTYLHVCIKLLDV